MKNTIKLTLLICILLLSFAVIFTACNNNSGETLPSDTEETGETDGTEAPTETDAPSKPTETPTEPVHQHVWGEWEVVQRASCLTGEGTEIRYCDSCDATETQAIYVFGHIEVVIPGKIATCTENGLSEGLMCVECQEILEEQVEIPATGHYEVDVEAKAPTCTEPGHTAGKKCVLCNEETTPTKVIAATGHATEKIEGTAATCTADGVTDGEYCKNCDYIKEGEVIPAGCILESWNVEPTCEKGGIKGGSYCKVCKTVHEEPEYLPKLEEHSFENGECIWCKTPEQEEPEAEEPGREESGNE